MVLVPAARYLIHAVVSGKSSLVIASTLVMAVSACKGGSFSGKATTIRKPAAGSDSVAAKGSDSSQTPGQPGYSTDGNAQNGAGNGSDAGNNGGLLGALGNLAGGLGKAIGSFQATNPVPPNLQACSINYYVPATANPYLAGVNSSLNYTLNSGDPQTPTDSSPGQNPVLVAPVDQRCISPGMTLYFYVNGAAGYSASTGSATANGDLRLIATHQLGSSLGKSDIRAPISSLLGVFLGDSDPSNSAAPGGLDYGGAEARNYTSLSPQVGQVFFIGTGRASNGDYHQVTVPQGASRLYFAVMDTYQWNNNHGGMYGAILIAKPQ